MRSLRLAAALAVLGTTATLSAQGPVSTGTNVVGGVDQSWQISIDGGLTFINAPLVAGNPGWVYFNGEQGGARWISRSASATTGVNPTSYLFRTTFNLTGYDPSTAELQFACWRDNDFVGISLNGVGVTGGCNQWTNSGVNLVTVSSGFAAGVNTLDFSITGDGTTDGLLVNVTDFSADAINSTVPEPGTWALLASGLVGLGVVARRRRA